MFIEHCSTEVEIEFRTTSTEKLDSPQPTFHSDIPGLTFYQLESRVFF